jgi:hypothetical protein
LPPIEEYPLRATTQEVINKLNEIIDALTRQQNIILQNHEQWTKYTLKMQKDMKVKLDVIRNFEEDLDTQIKLVKQIAKADLSDIPSNVPAIYELHKFAHSTLESIENMKNKDDPKILLEVQSKFFIFKNSILDYVEYLEMVLTSKGKNALEDLKPIIEERNKLTMVMAYTIKD